MSREKTKRNQKLVDLKEKGLSYGQIAQIFKFKNRKTAWEIYHRDKAKYIKIVGGVDN